MRQGEQLAENTIHTGMFVVLSGEVHLSFSGEVDEVVVLSGSCVYGDYGCYPDKSAKVNITCNSNAELFVIYKDTFMQLNEQCMRYHENLWGPREVLEALVQSVQFRYLSVAEVTQLASAATITGYKHGHNIGV